jgi:hypothetical protein
MNDKIDIYIYIYIYIYISHIHVYVYIYTYTHTTLKPNPLLQKNTMCTWICELVTKLSHNGFIVYLCVFVGLLAYIYKLGLFE